jgi:two-component system response regulator DesR
MTRVYLYSDQPILAKGLEAVLSAAGKFQLESSYSGTQELAERLQANAPDILLLDVPPEITFAVLTDIKPVILNCKLVLWVNAISTELAFQAMELGVRGILRKSLPTELQVNCLQRVQEGELWFEKSLTERFLAAKRVMLSPREGQLITLLSHGLKNKEIASTLEISEGTVKVYLSRLFQKVGVKDRFELALFGLKNITSGLAHPSENRSGLDKASLPSLRSLML